MNRSRPLLYWVTFLWLGVVTILMGYDAVTGEDPSLVRWGLTAVALLATIAAGLLLRREMALAPTRPTIEPSDQVEPMDD